MASEALPLICSSATGFFLCNMMLLVWQKRSGMSTMRDSLLYQYEISSPARPTCPSRIAAAEYASSV